MPGYETTVVTKPSIGDDKASAIKTKIKSVLKERSGELQLHEDWGSRRLAFRVQNESKGRYLYYAYTGDNTAVSEIERNLRINEDIMLHMSIRRNDGISDADIDELKSPSPIVRPSQRDTRPSRDRGDRDRDYRDHRDHRDRD